MENAAKTAVFHHVPIMVDQVTELLRPDRGGVSAALIFMGERLNKGGNKKDWSQLRTLPDGLLFGYSEKVTK